MFKKIINFAKSFTNHVKNGSPKSSQKLINTRYDICLVCSSFDKEKDECSVCGCNVNRKKIFMNKLAWQDSKCPLSKW